MLETICSIYLVYRMGGRGSKVKWLRIGRFEDWPLVRAREYARAYRAQVDAGIDPAKALEEKKVSGVTVAEVFERYFREYAPTQLRPWSIRIYHYLADKYLLPAFGKTSAVELNREIVTRWYASKPPQTVMNRALALLSSVCTQCEIWGLRPDGSNPCRHIKKNRELPRLRDIQPEELRAIGAAIKQLEDTHEHNVWALAAIKVIALCAGRVSEILSLKYDSDLRLDEGYALLREHKTSRESGAKYLELPPKAIEIIKALPVQSQSQWVFPSQHRSDHLSYTAILRLWTKICRAANVRNLHLHDFRSFAASEGLEQGVDARTTAKILGHASSQTTEQHYLRVRKRKTAEAAEKISQAVVKAFELE
jgi:integrase